MSTDEWSGILLDGETVLWQGQPDGRFNWNDVPKSKLSSAFFGLFFSAFWMFMASRGGGFFWVFGLFIFGLSAKQIYDIVWAPSAEKRASFYTLTNKRAFIGTNTPMKGKTLKFYNITPQTKVELQDGTPPSVFFASQTIASKDDLAVEMIGFQRIRDAAEVMRLIGKIQQGQIK